jgi:hypothetical protein
VAAATTDTSLLPFQEELLDIAYQASSKIPTEPYTQLKNRSKAQEDVVLACLELDQTQRARSYAEGILNWRRGAAFAAVAFHLAQRGDTARIPELLEAAEQESEDPQIKQAWRRDRIRAMIARTHAYLGDDRTAAAYEAGLEDSERGKVAPVRAMLLPEDEFEAEVAAIDTIFQEEGFDQAKNALDSCVELFNRFYEDEERREQVEKRFQGAWSGRLPVLYRVERLMDMAQVALEHDDEEVALRYIDQAYEVLPNVDCVAPRFLIPLNAKLAALRREAGQETLAEVDLEATMALYEAQREKIQNFFRAETLVPLAEAFQIMGETSAALVVYERALAEAVINPNIQHQAANLSLVCTSMARYAVEPSSPLMERIRVIEAGLGDLQ